MNLKSVTVVVFQSKVLTGGEGERGKGRVTERGSVRGSAKGKLETVLFSIDLSPDSHWLLLNKEEVG